MGTELSFYIDSLPVTKTKAAATDLHETKNSRIYSSEGNLFGRPYYYDLIRELKLRNLIDGLI